MGCGGSKDGVKNGSSEGTNGKVAPFDRRPKISVRIGPQAKKLDGAPRCVFIFGGPGSRKGRIVDDLVNSYGFQFVCGEDLIIQELPKKVSNIVKLETIKEIKNFVEEDPSHITLSWLLSCVERKVELGRASGATFLIDLIPNLRYLLKMGGLTEDNLAALQKFEEKYPVSFGLNLAIPVDKVLNAKSNYCAKPDGESKMKETGGQGDEADSSRTQKRAALYSTCAQPFLDYLARTERLVTVDVACGVADLIWHQVHDVMMDLDFHPARVVNTVMVFGWTEEDIADINIEKYLMVRADLKTLVDNPQSEADDQLLELRKHIDNLSRETDSFVVCLEGTKMAEVTELQQAQGEPSDKLTTQWWEKRKTPKVTDRPITFLEVEEGHLETYLPGSPKDWSPHKGCKRYKAICSLENEAYLFPTNTPDQIAIDIATKMATTRKATE